MQSNNKNLLRSRRTREAIKSKSNRARLSIFRSNKNIYCQIIDDAKNITLVSASTEESKDAKGKNMKAASALGKLIAEKAIKANIKTVVFDRGLYKYHGRVKTIAESARKSGLIF